MEVETAKQEIKRLVEKYNKVVEEKKFNKYNKDMTKKDFILPLFRALGWNIEDSNEVSAEKKYRKKDSEIDELAYKIYGITEEEKKLLGGV